MKNLTSDLVFGVPPLPEAIGPANTLPTDAAAFNVQGDSSKFQTFTRPRSSDIEDPCPVAPPGSAPLDSVPQDIAGAPRPGTYIYRYAIQYPKTNFRFEGFEKRGIGNIRGQGEDPDRNDPESARFDFRFTVSQELVGSSIQILSATTYGVDRSSAAVEPSAVSAFSGENPKGIYLLTIEETSNFKGKVETRKFNANPPIKYMTLPGIIGTEGAFRTSSVDPTTQTVITLEGETIGRQPVDACGEMIDTWYQTATQTITLPDGSTLVSKLEYGIATQLGGMFAYEHFEVPGTDPDRILDMAIGSVAPK